MKSSALSKLARRTEEPPISWLMHTALARRKLISLAAGFTDNVSLPVHETRDLARSILSSARTGQPALQYGTTVGDPQLREVTARHLIQLDGATARNKAYATDRLIITGGSQQLLYMTTEALCDPGDIVLVEDPTYFVYLGIAQSHGLRTRGVRMESDGIDLAQLEKILESLKRNGELPRLKLLYLVSYFQNPTGITTSFEKKREALKLLKRYERAAGHPIYLLEDAAYRELRFSGKDVPSALAAKGFEDRVIYAGTYSKPFATGVRVGFGVLTEPVFTAVVHIKGNHDFGTGNFVQQLMTNAIASGRYNRHVLVLKKRYSHKARVMHDALTRYFPADVQWDMPDGGLYFWARLPRGLKCGPKSKLFQAALAKDVLYVPGVLCYAEDSTRRKPDNEMRISFGSATEEDIIEGIKRLGAVLKQFLGVK